MTDRKSGGARPAAGHGVLNESVGGGRSARIPLAAFLLLAVVIVALGQQVYEHQRQQTRLAREAELTAIAEGKAAQVGEWLAERRAEAERLRASPLLRAAIADAAAAGLLRDELDALRDSGHYHGVQLFDRDGPLRIADPRGMGDGPTAEELSYVARAFESGQVLLSAVHRNTHGVIEIDMVAPVDIDRDGSFDKVLLLHVDPYRALYPMVQAWPVPSASAETTLVAQVGDGVTHLNDLRHADHPPLSSNLPLTRRDAPGVLAMLGHEGIVDGVDYRGEAVTAALRRVPGSEWAVVAKVDTEEFMTPLRRLFVAVSTAVVVLISVAALIVWLWWRRQRALQRSREDRLLLARERERAREERQWLALFNAVHHPLFIHDRELRIVRANPSYLQRAGARHEDIVGKPYWEVFPRLDGPLKSCVNAMHGKPGGRTDEIRLASGEVFVSRSYAAFDEHGAHLSSIHILEDVTEQRRMKARLRRSEADFRMLAESSPTGIFRTDRSGRCIYVNPRWTEITGAGEADALGEGWLAVFAADECATLAAAWSAAVARGEPLQAEHRFDVADGSPRWVTLQAVPERDERGSVLGYVGTLTDVSAQKRAELWALKTNELYALISRSNEIIVRVRDRQALFEEICQVAIDVGHLASTCIGLVGADGVVRVVARAGAQPDGEGGAMAGTAVVEDGLMLAAIRDGEQRVSAEVPCGGCDLAGASAAVFPLFLENRVIGAIGLQSKDPAYFSAERVDLLQRLAADLSYALDKLALEQERRAIEDKLRLDALVFEEGDEAITICDSEQRIVSVNKAFTAITGYASDEVVGRNPSLLSSGRQDRTFYDSMWAAIRDKGRWAGEIWNRRKNGEVYPEWLSIRAVQDGAGRVTHYLGVFADISARKAAESRVEFLSNFDALTELPNRSLFLDRLEQAVAYAKRSRQEVAVMFMNLDRFKNVNNSLGHASGDALLRAVSERVRDAMRDSDTVARLGGDEFAILAPGIGSQHDAAATARQLLNALRTPFAVGDQELFIDASVGVALYPRDGGDARAVLRNAASAMQRAKEDGRGHFQFYSAEMNARAVQQLGLENSLRRALERGEFKLHFQPQVNLESGRIAGAEALVRWQHPELGLVAPGNFIPLAEETGIIVPLGRWILRQACAEAAAWRASGKGDLRIAVNVSPRQFRQADFTAMLAETLEETGLAPGALVLEITEGLLMDDAERIGPVLRQVCALGVSFSIDDFGTGYSSLGYLKRFPISELKIDRSFVEDIVSSNEDSAIARAIITMAHSLNLRVVAEGVETEAQMRLLRRNRCEEAQGYAFATPVPAEEFAALLDQGRFFDPAEGGVPRTLLVVDDEPNVLSAIRRALRGEGYTVMTADTPAEAMDLLALHEIQVLVSDQRMPSMSGTEFLGKVKGMYPDTVRIVLSGYTELQSVTDAVNRGAIYKFLTKPWDDELLRQHIKDAFWRFDERRLPRVGTAAESV